MEQYQQVTDKVSWVGVRHPELEIFDELFPTHNGTTYNSYVVRGQEKTALIDTVKAPFTEEFLEKIDAAIGLDQIDLVVVSHTEPDHSGLIGDLIERHPDIEVVGTASNGLEALQQARALRPDGIHWPEREPGITSFRLEDLTAANDIPHTGAHDALADVEATIYMARLIRDRAPAVWDSLMPLVDKAEVQARVFSGQPLCLVQYHMGRPTVLPDLPNIREVVEDGEHALLFEPADAEDVLQTVFARLANRAEPPDLTGGALPYLRRAATNAALDIVQSKRARTSVAFDGAHEEDIELWDLRAGRLLATASTSRPSRC